MEQEDDLEETAEAGHSDEASDDGDEGVDERREAGSSAGGQAARRDVQLGNDRGEDDEDGEREGEEAEDGGQAGAGRTSKAGRQRRAKGKAAKQVCCQAPRRVQPRTLAAAAGPRICAHAP